MKKKTQRPIPARTKSHDKNRYIELLKSNRWQSRKKGKKANYFRGAKL